MRVSVLQDNLAKALSTVSRAISTRPTQPIYSNILITTEESRLKLAAVNTDQGVSITSRIGANVEEEGAITVPAKEFLEIINVLPPERVDLELDERTQTLTIKCAGRASSKLKGMDPEQFALMAEFDTDDAVTLPADVFQEMIDQVVFASAKEDNRPILMGILTKLDGDRLTMVAADGFRLAFRNATLNESVAKPLSLVIPARTLTEIARIQPGDDNLVYVSVPAGRSQVMFKVGEVEIISQLIDGKFPEVEHLVPKSASTTTLLTTKELLRACKYAEIFARNVNYTTRLQIKPGDGAGETSQMVVSSMDAERGNNEWVIDADIKGAGLEVSFNVRFLIDVLNVIHEDHVRIEMNGAASPGVVKPDGRDDFTYVIMPMSTR